MTIDEALSVAVSIGSTSPCAKSKRGVVIWDQAGVVAVGTNHQPRGFSCDGSTACREACNRLCVHAEETAILRARRSVVGCDMLHIKVVDGRAVPSGHPSCWQCSRVVLDSGIARLWLLHDDGLRAYSADEFHELTLKNRGLPVVRALHLDGDAP